MNVSQFTKPSHAVLYQQHERLYDEIIKQLGIIVPDVGYMHAHDLIQVWEKCLFIMAYVDTTATTTDELVTLTVLLHPGAAYNKLSMPTLIDQVWHTAILNTREYAAFCQSNFTDAPCGPTGPAHSTRGSRDSDYTRGARIIAMKTLYEKTYSEVLDLDLDENVEPESDAPFIDLDAMPSPVSSPGASPPSTPKRVAEEPYRVPDAPSKRRRTHLRFQVFVKSISGKTVTPRVTRAMTVLELKTKLFGDYNTIRPKGMRLIFAGNNLDNSQTLGHYNIRADITLHMVENLRGC
jgi:hypothetical protein